MFFFFSLLIAIVLHEAGHLIVAKLCKCKVEIFSVGFGKPLYKKQIKETAYQLVQEWYGDDFNREIK